MTIHPNDGSTIGRIWGRDGGGPYQIDQIHTKIDGKIWSKPIVPDFPTGDYLWGLGDGGSAVGYYEDAFGTLTPNTLGGLVIQYLQVLPTDRFRLAFANGGQLPDVVTLELIYTPLIYRPINLYWTQALFMYESPASVEASAFIRNRVGTDHYVNLNIL